MNGETEIAQAPAHSACSRRDALWLCVYGGLFGLHRVEANRVGGGWGYWLLWLLAFLCLLSVVLTPVFFVWLGFNAIWWLVDLVTILRHRYRDGAGILLYEHDDGYYTSSIVYMMLSGPFGFHRLYAGKTASGMLMMLLSLCATVIIIMERIICAVLRCLFSVLSDGGGTKTTAELLAKALCVLLVFKVFPMLDFLHGMMVFMIVAAVCYIVMAIWSFIDFCKALFGTVYNAYGNPMVADEDALYSLRSKHSAGTQPE